MFIIISLLNINTTIFNKQIHNQTVLCQSQIFLHFQLIEIILYIL